MSAVPLLAPPAPTVRFEHLGRLTDAGGLHEHADGTTPRLEHGYCVDDVARGLVVTTREPIPGPLVDRLRRQYLAFVVASVADDGGVHNRWGPDLAWHDAPSVEDCWGRAVHGLGTVVGAAAPGQEQALAAFERAARRRSPHPRATAMAGLGAAEVLRTHPDHAPARALLADAADRLAPPTAADGSTDRAGWVWPEPRLRYANAVLPELLVAAGHLLARPSVLRQGLDLLAWVLDVQTRDGHLSVVPVRGLGPDDDQDARDGDGPGADQQPVEVGVLADACARAHEVTGDDRWADGVRLAAAWFLGDNDRGTTMVDLRTGGGFDGLEPHGRNDNQGAESTLAAMATLQHAARLTSGPSPRTVRPPTPEVPA